MPKLLRSCSLPLTGKPCVDLVITDLGVFTITQANDALCLTELAPGVTVEQIRAATEADFTARFSKLPVQV
jgi:3-oxoacid CoA-transferase subunit B